MTDSQFQIISLAIPVVAFFLIKSKAKAFLIAVPPGVLVLWTRMIQLEASAPDSDLDIVFQVALVLGGFFLVVLYAAIFLLLAGLQWCYRRLRTTGKPAATGEDIPSE